MLISQRPTFSRDTRRSTSKLCYAPSPDPSSWATLSNQGDQLQNLCSGCRWTSPSHPKIRRTRTHFSLLLGHAQPPASWVAICECAVIEASGSVSATWKSLAIFNSLASFSNKCVPLPFLSERTHGFGRSCFFYSPLHCRLSFFFPLCCFLQLSFYGFDHLSF